MSLFTSKERFIKYLRCILIGVPIWYVIGVLITFSPEFSSALNIIDNKVSINAGDAIMFSYLGLVLGDMCSGLFSQLMKSRKKIIFIFLILTSVFITLYFLMDQQNHYIFYTVCTLLGFAGGYWAVFVTIAAEQFGINLRATVTTTVPNFVRGSVILVTTLFVYLKGQLGILYAGSIVGVLCMIISFWSLYGLKETFGKDLNYVEE